MLERAQSTTEILSDEELAEAIADELKPWNGLYTGSEIIAAVLERSRRLRACHIEHFERGAVQRTRDNAREIIELTNRLKRKLMLASSEIGVRLNTGESAEDLDRISQACQLAESESLEDGRGDQTKDWCARIAWGLFRFSEKLPTTESMMKIAPLLYEAATTGKKVGDLKRSCEAYIKATRSPTK